MSDKQSKRNKSKYLSLRKALKELKINEDDLKKMVNNGYINPIYEGEEARFNQEEINKVSRHIQAGGVIEDEDLYKSTDGSAFESLFLTGTHEVAVPVSSSPTKAVKAKNDPKPPPLEQAENMEQFQLSRQIVKEAEITVDPHSVMEPVHEKIPSRVIPKTKLVEQLPENWKKTFIIYILLLIAILIVGGFVWAIISARNTNSITFKIQADVVHKGKFHSKISAEGIVVPGTSFAVYARVPGQLAHIYHSQGAPVRVGNILAEIKNTQVERDIEIAREEVARTKLKLNEVFLSYQKLSAKASAKDLDVVQKLKENLSRLQGTQPGDLEIRNKLFRNYLKKVSLSHKNLYQGELRYQIIAHELQIAEKQLEQKLKLKEILLIKAPASGKLMMNDVKVKSWLTAGTLLANIVDPSSKEIEVEMDRQVAVNTPVDIHFTGIAQFKGVVLSTGFFPKIRCRVKGDLSNIPYGTKAKVIIQMPARKTVFVSKKTVVHNSSLAMPVVFKIIEEEGNYSLEAVDVKLGMSNDQYIEIQEGLEGNESIVASCNMGMFLLSDGMIVTLDSEND